MIERNRPKRDRDGDADRMNESNGDGEDGENMDH